MSALTHPVDLPKTEESSKLISQIIPSWTLHSAFGFCVALVTFLTFFPSLSNGFVNWDDPVLITENPHIRQLSWRQMQWMFSSFHMGPYQPLAWLSLAVDHAFWGLNPLGFHLTSLVLHVCNAWVLLLVARRLLSLAQPGAENVPLILIVCAALSAMLFSIHPLRVESVAWASERRDVLSGLFVLWCVWAYLRAAQEGPRANWNRWLMISRLLFLATLLSKATAVGLPAVLTVLDVYPLRRLPGSVRAWFRPELRRIWSEKIPFWVLSGIAAGAAIYGQRNAGALTSAGAYDGMDRIAIASYAAVFYVVKTFWPANLSGLYEMPNQLNPWELRFVVAEAFCLGVTLATVLLRRSYPQLLAAWLAYWILLAPVSGLAQTGAQIAADRYTYLPCLSFALIGGGTVLQWSMRRVSQNRAYRLGLLGALTATALILGPLAVRQTRYWSDSEAMWRRVLAVEPESSAGHTFLGAVLMEHGQLERGLELLSEAARLRPSNPDAHHFLGLVYHRMEQSERALSHCLEAWKLRPHAPEICVDIGSMFAEKGAWKEAEPWYERAFAVRPDHVPALAGLGRIAEELGKNERAIALYKLIIEVDPNNTDAYTSLGFVHGQSGNVSAAIGYYLKAWRLDHRSAGICYNLGSLYLHQREWSSAKRWFESCLAIDPNYDRALSDLATIQQHFSP